MGELIGLTNLRDFKEEMPAHFERITEGFEREKEAFVLEDANESHISVETLVTYLRKKNVEAPAAKAGGLELDMDTAEILIGPEIMLAWTRKQTQKVVNHIREIISGMKDIKFINMVCVYLILTFYLRDPSVSIDNSCM